MSTLLCVHVPDFGASMAHDIPRTRAVWTDMLDALDAVSPLVDDTAEGLAYLDMRGISGDPQSWMASARQALCRFDLPVRVALGSNKFVARVAAHVANGNVWTEGQAAALLAPVGIDVLEIDPAVAERLHLLGIHTLGELARLPHGPFVRRFGKAAATWHRCARGVDTQPLRPRAHDVQIDAALYGEGTAQHEEQVLFALRVLTDRVCGDLSRAGRGAGLVAVTFECENSDVRTVEVRLSQPTADTRTLFDVVRAKIEGLTFDAPVSGVRLQALRLEEAGTEASLFARASADPQAVALAIARLEATLGSGARRARLQPAHRLESRFTYEPFIMPREVLPEGISALPNHPVPQLRLLAVREIAVEVRHNLPVRVEKRRVRNCAGPWRIDEGWFSDGPIARDEYDVRLEDGALYRIYRQGDHWYLRGAYD